MMKKLIIFCLCLILALSFVACKKNNDDNSSIPSDPTQDFTNDEWEDGAGLTDDEKQEIEDLWNDLKDNGNTEIEVPGSSDNTSSGTSSDKNESNQDNKDENSQGSSSSSSSSDKDESNDELKGEIGFDIPIL